ncbi:hypothetical protein [Aureimonas sp. ME7]|uniref:hypothetical protein n=1 Tax=Aureimonas sp. ME7 TaxID=2744252 RepID=UPI001FCE3707|nr:hypothetical protein [Aureimonas sp. ME7]
MPAKEFIDALDVTGRHMFDDFVVLVDGRFVPLESFLGILLVEPHLVAQREDRLMGSGSSAYTIST